MTLRPAWDHEYQRQIAYLRDQNRELKAEKKLLETLLLETQDTMIANLVAEIDELKARVKAKKEKKSA